MDNCLTEKRQIESIDILKYILSVLIIAYHASVFADIDYTASRILRLFTNTATGTFFVISGYILGSRVAASREQSERLSVLLKSAKRLILLWAVWEVLYTPFIVYKLRAGISMGQLLIENYLLGSYSHLWYLKASAIAVILIWALKKAGIPDKLLLILACLCFLIGAYMLSVAHNTFFRNGVFFAFPYYVLGNLIAEKQDLIIGMPRKITAAAAIGIFAVYTAENIIISTGQSSFTMPFACAAILILFLRLPVHIGRKEAGRFRHLSTLNYTIHYGVFSIFSHFNRTGTAVLNSVELFCMTLLITTVLAVLVLAIQTKMKFLRILY